LIAIIILSNNQLSFSQEKIEKKKEEKSFNFVPVPYVSYNRTYEFMFGAVPMVMYNVNKKRHHITSIFIWSYGSIYNQ
jgi:hypothetical protein